MPAPWEQFGGIDEAAPVTPGAAPWKSFEQSPAYNYIEPDDEGADEDIYFQASDERVKAPRGTGLEYSKIENDSLFDTPSTTLEATSAQFEKLAGSMALTLVSFGALPADKASEFIADRNKTFYSVQERNPEHVDRFSKEWAEGGVFGKAGALFSNPRAIGRQIVTQTPNAVLPILTTYTGAKMMGKTGGVVGAYIGTSIMGTLETMDEILVKDYGVNMQDAESILNVLSNPDKMKDIRNKAIKAGAILGVVDSVFQIFGGGFLKAFKGAGKVGRVAAGMADVAVQSVGETTGEAARQYSAFKDVDWDDAVLEGVISLSQSMGQTAIGATVGQGKAIATKKGSASKIEGVPDTLFHSTTSEEGFQTFDLAKAGQGTDQGNVGVAVYLSPQKSIASGTTKGAGRVIETSALIKNPIEIIRDGNYKENIQAAANQIGVEAQPVWSGTKQQSREFAEEFSRKAQEAGFDSVVTRAPNNTRDVIEVAVFDVENVDILDQPSETAEQSRIYTDDEVFDFSSVGEDVKEAAKAVNIDLETATREQQQVFAEKLSDIKELVPDAYEDIKAKLGEGLLPIPRGKIETLSQFLKRHGGLKSDTGEAARFTRKETPGLKGVANRNGILSLDQARELAVEAGYILDVDDPNVPLITTTNELVQALEDESNGIDIVASGDADVLMARRAIEDFNENLDRIRQEQFAETRIPTVKEAFKKGVSLAKKDVKAAQEAVISAIESSGLAAADRAKFIRSIKNIDSASKAVKNFPKIQERVIKLLDAELRRDNSQRLLNVLKSTKLKKAKGRPVGRFKDSDFTGNSDFASAAEFQAEMNKLRDIAGLKLEDGKRVSIERANEILLDPENDLAGHEKAILATVLKSDLISANDSAKIILDLRNTLSSLRASGRLSQIAKRLETNKLAEGVADQLITAADIKALDISKLNEVMQNAAKGTRTFFDFSVRSWDGLRNAAFSHKDVSAKELIEKTSIFKEEQDAKRLRLDSSKTYRDSVMEALGTTRESVYINKSVKDHKPINIGKEMVKQGERTDHKYIDAAGDEVNFNLSIAQIRYMWMQMQTPQLQEVYFDENSNAFTPEMVGDAFSFLKAEDYKIMEARFEAVDSLWEPHNKVYSKLNGVDLMRSDKYFPLQRENSDKDSFAFQDDQAMRSSLNISAQKGRTRNFKKIKMASDEAVMQRHILEVAHYTATAEKLSDIRRIFGNQRLRNSIESRVGKNTMRMIDNQINDFIRGRVVEGGMLDSTINKMNANFASSVLLLKPAIGVKQLTSIPAYLEFVPAKNFAIGMADYIKNPRAANKILKESSAFVEDRGANPEKSIADVARVDAKVKKQLRVPFTEWTLENIASISIRLGDVGAINAGGWSVYKYNLEVLGKTHKESITAFEEASAKRQQTKDLSQLSSLQRAHSLGRSMTQFSSAPLSYLRAEIDAVESAIRLAKKGSKVEGSTIMTPFEIGRTLAIYHFLIPSLWQFVADGLDYEVEHQMRAAILGSFNSVALIGQLGANILAGLMGDREYDIDAVNFPEAIAQMGHGIVQVIENGTDIETEEFYKAVKNLTSSIGRLTGKPIKQGFDIFEGVKDFDVDNMKKSDLIVLGWPAGAVKDEKKGKF